MKRAGLDDGTDVVTIGVGGNSLPFAGILTKCVELGAAGRSCQEYYENPAGGEEGMAEKLVRSTTSTSRSWPRSTARRRPRR